MSREAMEMALNALTAWDARGRLRVIEALRAALAQPKQKSLAQIKEDRRIAWGNRNFTKCNCDHIEYCAHCFPFDFRKGGYWDQQEALAQPDHLSDCAVHNEPAYPAGECDCKLPVAWADRHDVEREGHDFHVSRQQPAKDGVPLYAAPPAPTKLITVGGVLEQAG